MGMALPITQLGSLSASAAVSARPGAAARQAGNAGAESNPVKDLLNGASSSKKPTLHVRNTEQPTLTRIHVSRVFTRAALREAFDNAVGEAMSVFYGLGDDGKMESRLLSGDDSEQFFSMDSPEQVKLMEKVQSALDDERFDDAKKLLTGSIDLFNKDNAERFKGLAEQAGKAFEASLKHSLGHVRMNFGGDFTAMMTRSAEEGGKLVEEALRGALLGGGDGLGALTQATVEGVDALLSDDRRGSCTTEGRAALLRAGATSKEPDTALAGAGQDTKDDEPEVTGNLLADVASLVKHGTLWDSDTMTALKDSADEMAAHAESMLKDGIGVHSLRIEFDMWLESPQKKEDGKQGLDSLLPDVADMAAEEESAVIAEAQEADPSLGALAGARVLFVTAEADAFGSEAYNAASSRYGSFGSASALSGLLRDMRI
ncbi:hypothetical protein [Paucidesulfovibrio longus]|uniref:hypothetical protein n=1 Tax=Paucidesulfovibrio longus TaxID=889 RepID=UPI0003B5705A|nr:hypothetical protein [Paucidesulfovibrio longus]